MAQPIDVGEFQRRKQVGRTMFKKIISLPARLIPVSAIVIMSVTTSVQAQAQDQAQISFEQIYAAPDDEQLNLAYAQQQADKGELSDAAATLERMLYGKPNWDSVRLFYALVLYRLDDRRAAQHELSLLDDRPLTPAQRETFDAYQASFTESNEDVASAATGLRGRLAIGARYDDNAGNAIGDVVFGGNDKPDESLLFQSITEYSAPIADGSSTSLVLRGDVQLRRHEDVSRADYDVYGLQGGFKGALDNGIGWTARAEFLRVNVATERYLNRGGATVGLNGSFSDETLWTLAVSGYGEDFFNLNFTTNETERNGNKYIADAGVSHQFGPTLNVGVNVAYEDKSARNAALAYDGWRLRGRGTLDLGKDIYLRADAEYRQLDYDADSPFLFPFAARADDNLRLRGALGVPVNSLAQMFGGEGAEFTQDMTLEFGFNYYNRDTNIPDADYENLGGGIKLIYGF